MKTQVKMLNNPLLYDDVGRRCARARHNGDAALAQSEKDYARAMWSLESPSNRLEARRLFDEAYRETAMAALGAPVRLA